MRIWICPCDVPDVFAMVRPDADTTIALISDGLDVGRLMCAAVSLATTEERDWVRRRLGLAPVAEDPSYVVLDTLTGGSSVWDRTMIPEFMRWREAPPYGELPQTAVG